MRNKLSKESLELALVMCYQLWVRRNAFIFQNQFMHPGILAKKAQVDLSFFKETKQNCLKRIEGTNKRGSTQRWKPPTWPYVKVNFDAAFEKAKGRMVMGVIIKDSEGRLLAVVTVSKDHISTAAQAESAALHRAMDLCTEVGINQACFEGDAKVVVDAVNSKNEDNSWLGQMTEDLQQLMKSNQASSLNFVNKSANKAAHTASKLAIRDVC
ncbi:hypothetical protein F2P56_024597 [Juglans regia]|uniref:RNase H type-1 domain-containing protein n=2 Tax=Juglans regia TaxID=51240 RepID=A0A833X0T5_JUGRE|nr:uncharacterized protein LOC109018017 [Juglans regia]KAF5454972.1 hypothetical protein F2P56_024597 [Juglans regia]